MVSNLKFWIIGILIATLIGLGVAIKLQSNKIKELKAQVDENWETQNF